MKTEIIEIIMKQLWYNTARKYKPFKRYETNTSPSQTIPGEAYTIQQIMQRALAGQPPEYFNAEYFDEEDLDRIDQFFAPGQLDLTDLDIARDRIAEMHHLVEKALEKKAEEEKTASTEKAKEVNIEGETKKKEKEEDK